MRRRLTIALLLACATVSCRGDAEPARRYLRPTSGEHRACGRERWDIKTGTDAAAGNVDLAQAQSTSIREMVHRPNPVTSRNGGARFAPVETTIWRIEARLVGYKAEEDSDLHLVVADDAGNTMIVELPSPDCVGDASPFRGGIIRARDQFTAHFAGRSASRKYRRVENVRVVVTGVGFFDFSHGQTGVAPNAVELHPVLDIQFQ